MKYKQMYEEIKNELADVQYDLNNEKRRRSEAESELQLTKRENEINVNMVRASSEEIEWLRQTLRLVIVEKGKMVELSKAIQDEQERRMQVRY